MLRVGLLAALASLATPMWLTDEVFVADAQLRTSEFVPSDAVLQAACADRDASTPAFKLTYREEGDVCVWRPWRVGTYMVVDECEC